MSLIKVVPYVQGPRNGFQLTGAQSAISAGGGCLNQAPSPWPQIGPKLTGAWHPLPKIDGCSCTLCTRSNEGPVKTEILKMKITIASRVSVACAVAKVNCFFA